MYALKFAEGEKPLVMFSVYLCKNIPDPRKASASSTTSTWIATCTGIGEVVYIPCDDFSTKCHTQPANQLRTKPNVKLSV
jgi:hypothetical protein